MVRCVDSPPPVKVGACRAISHLLPESNHGMHEPQIMGLLTSLINLLKQVMHLYKLHELFELKVQDGVTVVLFYRLLMRRYILYLRHCKQQ